MPAVDYSAAEYVANDGGANITVDVSTTTAEWFYIFTI